VQNLSYGYDLLGNPLSRTDANTNLSETFSYDALYRLTASTVNLAPTPLAMSFTYSAVGNILTKSDVGHYAYPAADSPQPHAVTNSGGRSRPLSPMTPTATRFRASAAASSSPPTTSRPASRRAPAPSASSTTPSTSALPRSSPRAPRSISRPSA
jgi:YD repeat-containing protein